jgi:hypothetical protein
MPILEKRLNLKKYLLLSLLTITVIELAFSRSFEEALVLLAIFIASLLNQTMLLAGLKVVFTFQNRKPTKWEISKAALLMAGKTLILGIAFYIGIHFIKDRIIVALFIYTVQLANLFFSIKR